MTIPDPIERGEASAERAYDELSQPDGKFKCYLCGAIFDPDEEGGTLSPDPYAMPVCGSCFDKEYDPTPYCSCCKARWKKDCTCPPDDPRDLRADYERDVAKDRRAEEGR